MLAVASSADGTKLAAAAVDHSLYISTDSGATWTNRSPGEADWVSLASSADGTKLVVAAYWGQELYTSIDSGVTWTPRGPALGWTALASSADGTKLVAGVHEGQIYTSTDSGVTWTARMTDTNRNWYSVASSADGSKLVAAAFGDQIYTSVGPPIPLTTPPTLLGATNRVAEATDPSGAVVTFTVTATNTCQPHVPVTCTPSSGSNFPLGTNLVTCVATDAFGVTNSAVFAVTVVQRPVFGVCTVAAPGQFRLHGTGTPGLTYTLQTSTNLVNWVNRTNVVAGSGGLVDCMMDLNTNGPTSFYRLRWP